MVRPRIPEGFRELESDEIKQDGDLFKWSDDDRLWRKTKSAGQAYHRGPMATTIRSSHDWINPLQSTIDNAPFKLYGE